MERFSENELDPLNLCAGPDMMDVALRLLEASPDKILPVCMKDPGTGIYLGGYSLWLYKNRGKHFLVVENFSSSDFEKTFRIGNGEKWQKIQPGIYQIEYVKSTHA